MFRPQNYSLASTSEVQNGFNAPERWRLPSLPMRFSTPLHFNTREGSLRRQQPVSMVPFSELGEFPLRPQTHIDLQPHSHVQPQQRLSCRARSQQRNHNKELSEEEKLKKIEKNRLSGQRFRARRKERIQALEEKFDSLAAGNSIIETDIQQLREAVKVLQEQLEWQNRSENQPTFVGSHSIFATSQEEQLPSNEITESSEFQSPEACGM